MTGDVTALLRALNRGEWLPDRVMHDEWEGRRPVAGQPMDVVFIRDDGWTLGARAELEEAAARTWRRHWVRVLRRTDDRGWIADDAATGGAR